MEREYDSYLEDYTSNVDSLNLNQVVTCWLGWTLASFITHPMDVVRVRLYNDFNDISKTKLYKGTFHGLRTILQNEGIKSLYKGYLLHSFSHIPYFTFSFYFYQQINQHSQYQFSQITNGGLAYVISRIMIYPFENITHRLIINGSNGYYKKYQNTTDCCKKVFQKEGIRGFYQGFTVGTIGLFTNAFIQFQVYKSIKEISKI